GRGRQGRQGQHPPGLAALGRARGLAGQRAAAAGRPGPGAGRARGGSVVEPCSRHAAGSGGARVMDTLAKILGLNELRFGAQGGSLEWARPMPGWVWTLVILAVLVTAGWSYWRLTGPRFARGVLGLMRAIVLALLVVLIAGPQLVRRPERVER